MRNNIREYHTLNFFRGKERNNAERLRLAEAGLDFEYRRLLMEENVLDLYVAFSKTVVWKWLSWSILSLAVYYIVRSQLCAVRDCVATSVSTDINLACGN